MAMASAIARAVLNENLESVNFLNELVANVWPYANIAVSQMTIDTVQPKFKVMLPGPFRYTTFKKVDLGPNPFHFDKVHSQTRQNGFIKLHLDVSWNGKCDITLDCPLVGEFGVEALKVRGRVSVVMHPLIPVFPVVSAVQIGFLNPPELDMDFTGMANILDYSLLRNSIRALLNQIFASIFVLPNRYLIKMNPTNDYRNTVLLPMGFLRVTLISGTGFKTQGHFLKDVPDVYCILSLGGELPLTSTTVDNDNDPRWNEDFDFLLSDYEQLITVHAWDSDTAMDDDLGKGHITVQQLMDSGNTAEIPLFLNGEDTGERVTLRCEQFDLSNEIANFDTASSGKHRKCGLLTIIVAEAVGLQPDSSVTPHCQVKVGEEIFLTSPILEYPGIDPRMRGFDTAFRKMLTPQFMQQAPDVEFELWNQDTKMGTGLIEFDNILRATGEPKMTMFKDFEMDNGVTLKVAALVSSMTPSS